MKQDPLEAMIAESEAKVLELTHGKNNNKDSSTTSSNEPRERNKILFPDTTTIDPYDPNTFGYIELGTITGAHGVHGLVKIAALTDFEERLCRPGLRHLKAPSRRSPREVQLLEGRHRLGDEYLVKLEGTTNRDAAKKLRGYILYAREEDRPRGIEQDEYLVTELVGLDVYLEDNVDEKDVVGGKFVGTVGGVVLAEDMCAVPGIGQDMLEIVLPRGPGQLASWRDELVLIPLVPEIVPCVNISERVIHITPPPGLLDLTYVREEKVRIKGFLPPAQSID